MHNGPKEENYRCQKHLIFNKNKVDIFHHDLKNDLFPLSSMDNIENIYHNFATTLSSSINNFSIEVLIKTSDSRTNHWYDKSVKIQQMKLS